MPNLDKDTTWTIEPSTNGIILNTSNNFVDRNIKINAVTEDSDAVTSILGDTYDNVLAKLQSI